MRLSTETGVANKFIFMKLVLPYEFSEYFSNLSSLYRRILSLEITSITIYLTSSVEVKRVSLCVSGDGDSLFEPQRRFCDGDAFRRAYGIGFRYEEPIILDSGMQTPDSIIRRSAKRSAIHSLLAMIFASDGNDPKI